MSWLWHCFFVCYLTRMNNQSDIDIKKINNLKIKPYCEIVLTKIIYFSGHVFVNFNDTKNYGKQKPLRRPSLRAILKFATKPKVASRILKKKRKGIAWRSYKDSPYPFFISFLLNIISKFKNGYYVFIFSWFFCR